MCHPSNLFSELCVEIQNLFVASQNPPRMAFSFEKLFWRSEKIFLSPQFLFIQTLLIKWESSSGLYLSRNFFNPRPKLDVDSSSSSSRSSADHKSRIVQKGKNAIALVDSLLFALQITASYKEVIDTGVHNFVAWINVTDPDTAAKEVVSLKKKTGFIQVKLILMTCTSFYTLRSINYLNLILAFGCAFKSQLKSDGRSHSNWNKEAAGDELMSGSYISCNLIMHLMQHLGTLAALIGGNSGKIGQ